MIIALFVWWMLAVVEYLSRIANGTAVIIDEVRDNARWPSTPDYSEVLAEIKETLSDILISMPSKPMTPEETAELDKKSAEILEQLRRQDLERSKRQEPPIHELIIEDVIEPDGEGTV